MGVANKIKMGRQVVLSKLIIILVHTVLISNRPICTAQYIVLNALYIVLNGLHVRRIYINNNNNDYLSASKLVSMQYATKQIIVLE